MYRCIYFVGMIVHLNDFLLFGMKWMVISKSISKIKSRYIVSVNVFLMNLYIGRFLGGLGFWIVMGMLQ